MDAKSPNSYKFPFISIQQGYRVDWRICPNSNSSLWRGNRCAWWPTSCWPRDSIPNVEHPLEHIGGHHSSPESIKLKVSRSYLSQINADWAENCYINDNRPTFQERQRLRPRSVRVDSFANAALCKRWERATAQWDTNTTTTATSRLPHCTVPTTCALHFKIFNYVWLPPSKKKRKPRNELTL